MSQNINNCCWRLRLVVSLTTCTIFASSKDCAIAQSKPDTTLGSESSAVTTINSLVDQVDGGAIRGKNLFHSFQEFNVSEGREVYFTNSAEIENIISRVTGSKPSNIQGTLGVLGNANLFLLNPNGIIFGLKARLDIRGSFVASTANSLKFADGTQFSAIASQTSPLLTVSVPIGLQFGVTSSRIINHSQASPNGAVNSLFSPVGLQVQTGKTLALVGGEVTLEGGNLTAEGGRIEIGSVAGNSLVSINPTPQGWALGYESVQSFQDIKFSQEAIVDASGEGGGYIQLQGRDVLLKDASLISAETKGSGNGGDIRISTRKLIAQDGSQISTASSGVYLFEPPYFTPGTGKGGNLIVSASESVELSGISRRDEFSGFSSATFGDGKAGDITVNTRRLSVRDGGRITTASSGVILPERTILATGKGGNLTVNASEFVELTDGLSKPTGLLTATRSSGDAGDLILNTGRLLVRDNAEVTVRSEGTGNAGDLKVTARSISLEEQGKLTATITNLGKGGGNITLNGINLLLLRNGEVSTSALGTGNGGDINVYTDILAAVEQSNITATAIEGRGGNISITTQGLFLSPDSRIDASSEQG